MKIEFVKEQEVLCRKAEELHELTVSTCEMCGGTYEENLDGAINYFNLNGKRFKMTIEKI
jgi:hypothetical protein